MKKRIILEVVSICLFIEQIPWWRTVPDFYKSINPHELYTSFEFLINFVSN